MKKAIAVILLAALCCCLPGLSQAEEPEIYTLLSPKGKVLTRYQGQCEKGDEYISGDNQHYRVTQVDEADHTARTELIGSAEMPDVGWLDQVADATPVSAVTRKIALYCTHSDESYIEGDGTQSSEKRGGIYDVAAKFGARLEELGATVERSEETHHPHDAGAYRRSRQTAVKLLKGQPSAIFDLHRDGIPDPEEYAVTIGGEKMSKVRLLVGKSNQNREANLSFAKQIKAVGDKLYPKLIKDIYMGKGTYNQDLAPRSVLLEFGTHTLSKERVLRSTGPMAEVCYKALFGGVTGSAGASDVSGSKSAENVPADQSNKGSGAAVWIILALLLGVGLFAFLSTGGRGGFSKWKDSLGEMTGGFFGGRRRDK